MNPDRHTMPSPETTEAVLSACVEPLKGSVPPEMPPRGARMASVGLREDGAGRGLQQVH